MNTPRTLLVAACLMLLALAVPVRAQQVDLKAVARFPEGQSNYTFGNTFDVEIKVGESIQAQNLYGISFVLNYDSTLVRALSADEGDFLGSSTLFLPVIESGRVAIGMTGTSGTGSDGSGLLATVRFSVNTDVFSGGDAVFFFSEIKANDPSNVQFSVTHDSSCVVTIDPSDPPEITLSVTNIALGELLVDSSASDSFIISNTRPGKLYIEGINSSSGLFTAQPSSGVLDQDSSLSVTVSFSPDSPGSKSAVLSVLSNDPDNPSLTVSLSGSGKASFIVGDVDLSGKINIFDLLALLKYLKMNASAADYPHADCDGNGKIDIFDLLKLLQILKQAS